MEGDQIVEAAEVDELPPPIPQLNIGVAIHAKKSSLCVLNWALEKFCSENKVVFKLLHVFPKITKIPTPLGNHLPISQVREELATAFRKEVTWAKRRLILPYKRICTNRNVQAEIILIESDDIPKAMAQEIINNNIKRLILGVSSPSLTKREKKLSSRVSDAVPKFCSVYGVSKGKVYFIQQFRTENTETNRYERSLSSRSTNFQQSQMINSVSDVHSISTRTLSSLPSSTTERFEALAAINYAFLGRSNSFDCRDASALAETEKLFSSFWSSKSSRFELEAISHSPPNVLFVDDKSDYLPSPYASSIQSLPIDQDYINMELDQLRIQLRHAEGMYAIAQSEAVDASKKLNDLNKKNLEEAERLKEIYTKEEEAMELANKTKERHEAAALEADFMKLMAQSVSSQKQETQKMVDQEILTVDQYHNFSWDEIVNATSSFSNDHKIGKGNYGTVYKCELLHTTTAVKVLHSDLKQFHKEIEILSKLKHPNLLNYLGGCEEPKCIVYEYMENGNLDQRLQCSNNSPPLPWNERFRIAFEVASALAFLHSSKPNPIIHRDLKPANILLDQNLVSKIGDLGLSSILSLEPVGTFCYIDPEYQRTGMVSPKSDVYAFGIVILQLISAKPAIALTHKMETALSENLLKDMLDKEAGDWPMEETLEFAKLGLRCAELRRQDRPDLGKHVLPVLERLHKRCEIITGSVLHNTNLSPPFHFMCPISKDLMSDPCVASDGYTYDRKEIQKWFEENDKSPVTHLPLSNMDLLPNYTLLSAILDWKSKTNTFLD